MDYKMVRNMTVLSVLLMFADVNMLLHSISYLKVYGASMVVILGFEYALLFISLIMTVLKFALSFMDSEEREWHQRAVYVFYLELVSDFFKLLVYAVHFYVVLTHYGFPLHILRDIYLTSSSFIRKCRDWFNYKKAMDYMKNHFSTLNQEQLDQLADKVCIICREEMVANSTDGDVPKKLHCGHVFHLFCLRSWLARQQSCPTCRRGLLDSSHAAPLTLNPPTLDNLQGLPVDPSSPPSQSSSQSHLLPQTSRFPTSETDARHENVQSINEIRKRYSVPNSQPEVSTQAQPPGSSYQPHSTAYSGSKDNGTNSPSIKDAENVQSSSKDKILNSLFDETPSNISSKNTDVHLNTGNNAINDQILNYPLFNVPMQSIPTELLHKIANLGFPELIPLDSSSNNFSNNIHSQGSPASLSSDPRNLQSNSSSNFMSLESLSKPDLSKLTDSQIETLDKSTKELISERLRTLAYVQLQIQSLTQLLLNIDHPESIASDQSDPQTSEKNKKDD
ncbi:hypothetical protein BB560_001060 [Smittium megazygosporum]|uniref:RING-type E3 ubiquitin transferase n=1 Tax=Smittium megazygosporum TaxID=133381 RepID=A0A2T9ZIR0_9FUNG|nr:hypothetical protein BB560_001060 [Smittium megazygosporum]